MADSRTDSAPEETAAGRGAPLVSVVIPHYNRPQRLIETLKSVAAQTWRNLEVLVVDDASSAPLDELADWMAQDPRMRLVRLEVNGGPSAARNAGLARARGELVAFLDSDDLWAPDKIERQVAAFEGDYEGRIVTTRIEKRAPQRTYVEPDRAVAPGETFAAYLIRGGGAAQTSAIMLGRRAAQSIRFAADLLQFEDYLFFLRAGGLGLRHILVEAPLVIWFNDERDDRLSRGSQRNMDAAWRFLEAAGDLIDPRSRRVFLVKHVGTLYVRENPLKGLLGMAWALASRSIGWRTALSQSTNALLPRGLVRGLRRMWGLKTANCR
jgi:glycosyltransferase involved in cell wall biosynthesis